jgi:hypothetical protein
MSAKFRSQDVLFGNQAGTDVHSLEFLNILALLSQTHLLNSLRSPRIPPPGKSPASWACRKGYLEHKAHLITR